MLKRIECLVSAQRVGYSYLLWIGKTAISLGLKGLAFIKDDGSIQITAEGDDESLSKFIKRVKIGHPIFHMFITINNFFVKWHEPTNEFKDFSISVNKD
ncbi:MAG TPA: acylphosphatase [Candidatus Paceibacterota bacterium]|nr:acylphosphatase [Candidatus Paceibacterota bacterium]HPT18027.1 acylphosphatase [Candidatus Paceibacterota bacterium]